MLKELLLQFIISLLPVFAFQLWNNFNRGWRGIPVFICSFSALAMVLCMLVTYDYNGYEIDFRVIPYVIGSLYGGIYGLIGLTVIYSAFRIPVLDTSWETWSFVIFMCLFITMMLLFNRSFHRLPRQKKQQSGIIITTVIMVYYSVTIIGYMLNTGLDWTNDFIITFTLSVAASFAAVWISIFIIESLKENKELHYNMKRVSTSYRREVEKLQQFIDETMIAVIIVNHHGRITHINDIGYQLFHVQSNIQERTEIVGKYFTAFFNAEQQDSDAKLLYEALKGNKTQLEPRLEDGRTLLKTAFCIRNLQNGVITGAALIAQDITELALLRDEVGRMERLSLIGQMAASITHEIRNPMAVIRGFVQLMRERSPDNQQEYYQIVMEELDRANMIISDFLSLAQNRVLQMEMKSLHDIIKEMVPLLNADANLRGQSIEVVLCEYIPLIMLNDKEIKQLLLNLARNGMEAMNDKGVLRIHTYYSEENDRIELRIQDEGVGISQEQKKRLFEPFYTTKTRGTGLGLPLCLSIAERHNGRIDVESKESEGTTFIVSFNSQAVNSESA
ncbi:MAG: ATP-binding protein [Candidatus Pristimantibacillus sp.]